MAEAGKIATLNPLHDSKLQLLRKDSFNYTTVGSGHTKEIPADTEMFVTDSVSVVGTLAIDGRLTVWSAPKLDMQTIAITSDTTLSNLHHRNLVTVDASGGAVTISLPPAADSTDTEYNIKAIDITNAVTVDADGAETIDGALTQTLALYSTLKILCTGAEWLIV